MELLYFTLLITGFLLGPTLYCGFLPVCFFFSVFSHSTNETVRKKSDDSTPRTLSVWGNPRGSIRRKCWAEAVLSDPGVSFFCTNCGWRSGHSENATRWLNIGKNSWKFMVKTYENCCFFCDERGVHLDKKCEDVNLSIHIFWCYLLILILPVFEDPSYLFEKYVLRFLESKEIDQALTKTMKAEHWKNRWHTFQANELDYNWEIIIYIYSLYLYIYINYIIPSILGHDSILECQQWDSKCI